MVQEPFEPDTVIDFTYYKQAVEDLEIEASEQIKKKFKNVIAVRSPFS